MARTLTLLALALLVLGCTRYGTRTNGPFARRPPPDPNAPVPPGPPANSSPLALASDTRPEPPGPPDEPRAVPARTPDPTVVPAGGPAPADAPPRRPRPDQLPSPFAPRQPADPPAPAAKTLADLKAIVKVASDRWAATTDYEATLTRRELSPKGEMTSEVVLYQFRKEPMGLFTRNVGEAGKGREVVYSPAQHGDKLHLMIGEGDSPTRLVKAGFKPAPLSPDDPRVKEKARYSIREAGFGTHVGRVAGWVAKLEAGKLPADTLTFLGPAERPEVKRELVGVQVVLRPGDDPVMPAGGVRQWWFDPKPDSPSYGLPVLITAADPKGKEVEYYLFEGVRSPAGLTDADFSPDRLGKKR